MLHLTHPSVRLGAQIRAHRLIVPAALLALVTTVTVALALAIGGNPSTTSTADQPQAAVRADGGPDETGVAAAIAPQPTIAPPDESKTAAAVGFGSRHEPAYTAIRPDESAVAAAIAGN